MSPSYFLAGPPPAFSARAWSRYLRCSLLRRLFRLTLGKRRLVGWSKCHWLPARSELRAFCLALVRFHCQFRRWLLLGRNYRVPLLWLALRQRERRLVGRRRAHLFSSKLHGLLVMVSFGRQFRRLLWVAHEFRSLVHRGLERAIAHGHI